MGSPTQSSNFQPAQTNFTMKKSILLILALTIALGHTFAQTATLRGLFADQADNSPLIGVSVLLNNPEDSTQRRVAVTDLEGRFVFNDVPFGAYRLQARYLSYGNFEQPVDVRDSLTDLGTLFLVADGRLLKEVQVTEQINTATQRGDTT